MPCGRSRQERRVPPGRHEDFGDSTASFGARAHLPPRGDHVGSLVNIRQELRYTHHSPNRSARAPRCTVCTHSYRIGPMGKTLPMPGG